MRRLLLVATLLAAVLWPASISAASPVRRIDWVLMVVTAGPHGASNVQVTYDGRARGEGRPSTGGRMESLYDPADQRRPYVSCAVVTHSDGDVNGAHNAYAVDGPITHMDPGERLAFLTFVTNAELIDHHERAIAETGHVTVQRVYGTGSRDHFFAPQAPGTADRFGMTAHTGLAGGFVSPGPGPGWGLGVAAWTAPDGSQGEFLSGGMTTGGCPAPWTPGFAGESGRWRWSWNGASDEHYQPGVVAWAPIGRYWPVFWSGHVSPTDVGA